MSFSVTILGNNSAIPSHGRHPTAQIVEVNGKYILLDCGEGTQLQMQLYNIHHSKIQHICISHLHGDHYFGLIGLLSTMCMVNRVTPLHIYGPAYLEKILEVEFITLYGEAKRTFDLQFHAITPAISGNVIAVENDYSISCFETNHGIECYGYKISTNNKGRKILPEKIAAFQIPNENIKDIKYGADYITPDGVIIPNTELTLDPPPIKSYAYCADTIFTKAFLPFIENVNVMYHESTYLNDNLKLATERYHSTAEQAATVAKEANVSQLLIGHYSSRYIETSFFQTEASAIFPNVIATKEGDKFEII